jgi:predicted transcriptional regulator
MPSRTESPAVSLGPFEAEVMHLVWREGLRTGL